MVNTKHTCNGDGSCLTQTTDCNTYGKTPDFTCAHNCQPAECPNFAVCGTYSPEWCLRCHDGRCWSCNLHFGKNLTFPEEPRECPICFDTAQSVVQLNCTHSICIDCFKRMRVNGPPRTEEPRFPYPDREDEYFEVGNDPSNPLFHDPLVQQYNAAWNRWEDEWSHRYSQEENLRKCPLCRG